MKIIDKLLIPHPLSILAVAMFALITQFGEEVQKLKHAENIYNHNLHQIAAAIDVWQLEPKEERIILPKRKPPVPR